MSTSLATRIEIHMTARQFEKCVGSQSCASRWIETHIHGIPFCPPVALLLKCPLHQLQLQKIVGFRPPLEYLNADNRIYGPEMVSNFKTRNGQQELPVSQVCWRICNEDPDCIAYVHLLDTDECHGYSYFERTSRYLAISGELPLVADGEAVFYEKTCLRGE